MSTFIKKWKKKKYENCLFQNSSLRSREKSQGKTKLELNGMGIISVKQGMCVLSPVCSLRPSRSAALQVSLSLGFSRQEYWSRLPFSTPGDFPSHGSNSCLWCLLHWQMGSLPLSHLDKWSHKMVLWISEQYFPLFSCVILGARCLNSLSLIR